MHISLAAEKIFHIFSFSITNSIITQWFVVFILVVLAIFISKNGYRLIPSRAQNFIELIIGSAFSFIEEIMGSEEETKKIFPWVMTIFLFVLIPNWFGLLPGIGSVGFFEEKEGERILVPLFRSTNSDLNMTLALALISVFATQAFSIARFGFKKHWIKYFNFHNPIKLFVGVLELFSEFIRILSFSFRLFGNVFAGEVLLGVMLFLIPFIAPLPFLGLEFLVGMIQALIFSLLTIIFLKTAISTH